MLGLRLALMLAALMVGVAAPMTVAYADDEACLKGLTSDAGRARKTANVYASELKTVKNSPWSANATSVCNSAMARADQYFKRQSSDKALCTSGSGYVDDQVIHLYKNAVITCRSSYEDFLKTTTPQEQRRMTQRVNALLSESK